ncbi:nuclear transport factor 2 family protein [Rhodococcoides yunnanense]|uniref:Nuclear transport factor 2 family protein n=1 Tax=Rhodococcoides yunnanense TaxID=278209 RepID=A0ABU4BK91_9NOCA|nr:nuclear transport factor 2 family protein [Rhodococcus yunnanensis]MDV6264588.1 nuclear transport factor 2 family protein [Rhodococcus yunnanensis]
MGNSSDCEQVLLKFYAAEAKYIATGGKDFSEIASTLDPECVMYQPDSMPYAGEWHGHDGLERWMAAFGDTWASLTVENPTFYPSGADHIFVRSTVVARAKRTGTDITWPLLQMITVRDGRILDMQPFHWDTVPITAAAG